MTTPDENNPAGAPQPHEPYDPWAQTQPGSTQPQPGPTQPPGSAQPAPGSPAPTYQPQSYPPQEGVPTAGYPASPAPGYPTQQYPSQYPGQPQYPGQAQYPGQPNFDPAQAYAQPAKKMSTGVKVLLWVVPIVIVLAVAGTAVGLVASHNATKNTASNKPVGASSSAPAASPSSPGTTPSATPSTPAHGSGVDTFTMPKTALGLPKATDPTMTNLAQTMQSSLAGSAAVSSSAAIYQSSSTPLNIMIVVGIADKVSSPSAYANDIYKGLSASQVKMKPKSSYPPGSGGGSMWCADGSVAAGGKSLPLAVCDVTDNGGSLLVMYYEHSAHALARSMPVLRSKMEK